MTQLDRHLAVGFIRSWLICFTSLVSLYIVIDLFNKFDDFLEVTQGQGLLELLRATARYYGCQLTLIFDRLCGMMLLLAAIFTITWMQRNNELTPLLAAGVPVRRVLRPIWIVALFFIAAAALNREWIMPPLAGPLQQPPSGSRFLAVAGSYEPNGILLEGKVAHRAERLIEYFVATVPERVAGTLVVLQAREARYVPADTGPLTGGWLLTEAVPPEMAPWPTDVLTQVDTGKYFLKTQIVDFEVLTRSKGWHQFASLGELQRELDRPGARYLQLVAMQIHLRWTAPLIMFLTLVLGLGLILSHRERHFLISTGVALVMAAAFYGVQLGAKYLGENEYLTPALAAWLPILLFGPLAIVLQDAMPS